MRTQGPSKPGKFRYLYCSLRRILLRIFYLFTKTVLRTNIHLIAGNVTFASENIGTSRFSASGNDGTI